MRIYVLLALYVLKISNQHCRSIQLIDVTHGVLIENKQGNSKILKEPKTRRFKSIYALPKMENLQARRNNQPEMPRNSTRLARRNGNQEPGSFTKGFTGSDLKAKMIELINQRVEEAESVRVSFTPIKEKMSSDHIYRIGNLCATINLNMITTNELLNLAMKYRDTWKMIDQIKIYELLVHTNVDITNLLNQVLEHHRAIEKKSNS